MGVSVWKSCWKIKERKNLSFLWWYLELIHTVNRSPHKFVIMSDIWIPCMKMVTSIILIVSPNTEQLNIFDHRILYQTLNVFWHISSSGLHLWILLREFWKRPLRMNMIWYNMIWYSQCGFHGYFCCFDTENISFRKIKH